MEPTIVALVAVAFIGVVLVVILYLARNGTLCDTPRT